MKRCKSQYSVEFLLTYGWAILAIGIIVATIYTFGWFNPESILPQSCEFYGQVGCKDKFLSDSTFNLSLVNNFGENLIINGIEITSNGETCSLGGNDLGMISWPRNKFSLVGMSLSACPDFSKKYSKGDRVNIKATIYYFFNETCNVCYGKKYNDSSCEECVHKSTGTIVVRSN